MNPKFFDLNKSKQDKMINAALQIFAVNTYAHASTEEIVKLAEISKGLLFHYFTSKMGLYEFLADYSEKYIAMELKTYVSGNEKDYFIICKQVELAKFQVMKQFPYMILFLKTRFQEILETIDAQADFSIYGQAVDKDRLRDMVHYVLDGSMQEQAKQQGELAHRVHRENTAYLDMLQKMCSIYVSGKLDQQGIHL